MLHANKPWHTNKQIHFPLTFITMETCTKTHKGDTYIEQKFYSCMNYWKTLEGKYFYLPGWMYADGAKFNNFQRERERFESPYFDYPSLTR